MNGIYDHGDSGAFCGGDDGGGEGDNYYNVGQSDTSFCYVAQAGRELAMQIRIT